MVKSKPIIFSTPTHHDDIAKKAFLQAERAMTFPKILKVTDQVYVNQGDHQGIVATVGENHFELDCDGEFIEIQFHEVFHFENIDTGECWVDFGGENYREPTNWIERSALKFMTADHCQTIGSDDQLDLAREVMEAILTGPAVVLVPPKTEQS